MKSENLLQNCSLNKCTIIKIQYYFYVTKVCLSVCVRLCMCVWVGVGCVCGWPTSPPAVEIRECACLRVCVCVCIYLSTGS